MKTDKKKLETKNKNSRKIINPNIKKRMLERKFSCVYEMKSVYIFKFEIN